MAELNNSVETIFSGADICLIFGDYHRAEATSLAYTVQRDAGFVYTMGRKEPGAIGKGKRAVAGSFTLMQPGYDTLIKFYEDIIGNRKDKDIYIRKDENVPMTEIRRLGGRTPASNLQLEQGTGNIAALNTNDLWQNLPRPNYADQIPPFVITAIGKNEQGNKMAFRIWGVSIIRESTGFSTDELGLEKRYDFIAQSVKSPDRTA